MANGRGTGKGRRDTSRDGGAFVALPWSVLDSAAYRDLSHTARSLLLEVARQYQGHDNGRMLLSSNYLGPRGWNSPSVIQRAKRELIDAELIFETVKGRRPNKASWYAVTWRALDKIAGFDIGVEKAFRRSAYLAKGAHVTSTASAQHPARKRDALITPRVVAEPVIAISEVVETPPVTTSEIAIRRVLVPSPTTSEVDPLERSHLHAQLEPGQTDIQKTVPAGGLAHNISASRADGSRKGLRLADGSELSTSDLMARLKGQRW